MPSFPWLTGRIITVAGVEDVRALRINYVGELGYELHCPMASMPSVFDALMREGERHGITLFGTYAMNSLRMEKAYRAWGAELTNEVTMIEGAMERFVDLAKGLRRQGRHAQIEAGRPAHPARLSGGRRHRLRLPRQRARLS